MTPAEALASHRIRASELPAWQARHQRDPAGTRHLLASLMPVPPLGATAMAQAEATGPSTDPLLVALWPEVYTEPSRPVDALTPGQQATYLAVYPEPEGPAHESLTDDQRALYLAVYPEVGR